MLNLYGESPAILTHLLSLEVEFDAIYSGFLADPGQAEFIGDIFEAFPGALRVVDPVLGDKGKLYRTMDGEMVSAVRRLAEKAQIITPNVTEAAVLQGFPPDKTPYTEADARTWLDALSLEGSRSAVITGLSFDKMVEMAVGWVRKGASGLFRHSRTSGDYPGTGDLFTSFLLGGLLHGAPLSAAAKDAAGFVASCAAFTAGRGTDVKEGLLFEDILLNKHNR
jgi:pyridoxine kinase